MDRPADTRNHARIHLPIGLNMQTPTKSRRRQPGRIAHPLASRAAILATLLASACATAPPTGVAPLLIEARQNEVAAFAKYRERTLHVAGVVLQTGMDAFTRVVAEGSMWGISAREVIEHYPYMLVGDARVSSPDMVKCFFSTDDADLVGKLQPGMVVSFEGRFHQYLHDQGRLLLVLSGCWLD